MQVLCSWRPVYKGKFRAWNRWKRDPRLLQNEKRTEKHEEERAGWKGRKMLVLAGQILQRGHSLVTAAKSQEESKSHIFRSIQGCPTMPFLFVCLRFRSDVNCSCFITFLQCDVCTGCNLQACLCTVLMEVRLPSSSKNSIPPEFIEEICVTYLVVSKLIKYYLGFIYESNLSLTSHLLCTFVVMLSSDWFIFYTLWPETKCKKPCSLQALVCKWVVPAVSPNL